MILGGIRGIQILRYAMSYNNQNSLSKLIEVAGKQNAAKMHTNIPAIFVDYDYKSRTAIVQPAVKIKFQDGSVLDSPLISDVSVQFPVYGKLSIRSPIEIGDECMLHFCERSIDNFLDSGNVSDPPTTGLHSINDAVATPGKVSFTEQKPPPNNTDYFLTYGNVTIQITDGGEVIIDCNTATIKASQTTFEGDVLIKGDLDAQGGGSGNGAMRITGSVIASGDVTASGVSLSSHIHTGDDGGNTSAPQ